MTSIPPSFRKATSEGGPFIILGADDLPRWEGSDAPSCGRVVEATFRWQGVGSIATDYDRACDVGEPVGVLSIEGGTTRGDALVLADDSMTAGLWRVDALPLPLLIQVDYAEDEQAVSAALSALSLTTLASLPWRDGVAEFHVSSHPLYLFDSAYSGSEVLNGDLDDNFLTFDLPVGGYKVDRCEFNCTAETRLFLYRFVPLFEV